MSTAAGFSLTRAIPELVGSHIRRWCASSDEPPESYERYSWLAKRRNESETDRLIDSIQRELVDRVDPQADRDRWAPPLAARAKRYALETLLFPRAAGELLFAKSSVDCTKDFVRQARTFDPTLGHEALFQALRNVWIVNCIQMMLGHEVLCSPSIFAYSLLYPYTDNYLDDPSIRSRSKARMIRRLGRRLHGEDLIPLDNHEEKIFCLIAMIETDFPRNRFPQVHQSLRAIHEGQIRSLDQRVERGRSIDDLLRIGVHKGGASVLADGCLVAGRVSRPQAEFFFGYGVVLQFLDDLQDVREDREAGWRTLFSALPPSERLDRTTSRLHHFIDDVLDVPEDLATPQFGLFCELIRRNCTLMLLQAVALHPELFRRRFRRRMNRHSPLRPSFVRRRQETVAVLLRKMSRRLECSGGGRQPSVPARRSAG